MITFCVLTLNNAYKSKPKLAKYHWKETTSHLAGAYFFHMQHGVFMYSMDMEFTAAIAHYKTVTSAECGVP